MPIYNACKFNFEGDDYPFTGYFDPSICSLHFSDNRLGMGAGDIPGILVGQLFCQMNEPSSCVFFLSKYQSSIRIYIYIIIYMFTMFYLVLLAYLGCPPMNPSGEAPVIVSRRESFHSSSGARREEAR